MIFISRLSDTTAYFGPRVRMVFIPQKMQLKWPGMMMMLVGWGRVFMTIYDCDCRNIEEVAVTGEENIKAGNPFRG